MSVGCIGGQSKAEAVGQDCQYEESMGRQGTEFKKYFNFLLPNFTAFWGPRSNHREHLNLDVPQTPLVGMFPVAHTRFFSPIKIVNESLSTA